MGTKTQAHNHIDIETCSECGGAVKIIACFEDPVVIHKILEHLQEKAALAGLDLLPQYRAPPAACLSKPTIQTIGCYDHGGAVSCALQAGIGLKCL